MAMAINNVILPAPPAPAVPPAPPAPALLSGKYLIQCKLINVAYTAGPQDSDSDRIPIPVIARLGVEAPVVSAPLPYNRFECHRLMYFFSGLSIYLPMVAIY